MNLDEAMKRAAMRPSVQPKPPGSVSIIKIKVYEAVGEERQDKNGVNYSVAIINFKNLEDGKTATKTVAQFSDIFKTVCEMIKDGNCYEIKRVKSELKNDKSFWEWVDIQLLEENDSANDSGGSFSDSVEAVNAINARGNLYE